MTNKQDRGSNVDLILASAIFLSIAGFANAREVRSVQPRHVVARHGDDPCRKADCAQRDLNGSGTVGRNGLGADPFHPEGPGNISN